MKTLLFFLVFLGLIVSGNGQNYVNLLPADKNVILEEFTGVRCPNCPAGHQLAQTLIDNNPGRVWVVAFHPYNSSYTEPYAGNPDFRRHHPDSLYMIPYCGTSRYMPSAFINRRKYGAERLQGTSAWTSKTAEHLAEASPVNVGLATIYDSVAGQLTVQVEIYYTANMTDMNSLNVVLTESGIVAQQASGGNNYVHKRIFREAFTGQWGDTITGSTVQGSFLEYTFTFDNTTTGYDMSQCEVIAYVNNLNNDEVISGIGVHVGEFTYFTAPLADFEADPEYVNPGGSVQFTDLSTGVVEDWQWIFTGGNPGTFSGQNPPPVTYSTAGTYPVSLTVVNAIGNNTMTKLDYIHVDDAPVAAFSFETTQNPGTTLLALTDISTGNPASWQWTFENGNPATSVEQNPTVEYTETGTYTITLTVESPFGQDTETKEVDIDVITDMEEAGQNLTLVYPNPASDIIRISFPEEIREIRVIKADGTGIRLPGNGSPKAEIDVRSLETGIYFIEVTGDGFRKTSKVLISH